MLHSGAKIILYMRIKVIALQMVYTYNVNLYCGTYKPCEQKKNYIYDDIVTEMMTQYDDILTDMMTQ